ncbi:hypothetical protein SAMN04489844_3610 [Nocardioides exalbidus]|uniref:Uncharacterized protein n=1 Tax=Nocardioides exalbidus TaxID=402596 RepID=A0A1H4XN51_9ACTN|nr:hypothetical protein [Nocardioides exalbidus]SED07142.1 hypothetical protein SAMN04489844_3610 [Nocardioides exalbidus]
MRLLVAGALAACLLTGCSGDPQDGYCSAVEDHQAELTEIAASDDTGALFDALDAYDDLAGKAPRDIADDWADVVDPLHELQQVLAAHDVDPSTYSAEQPPAGLDQDARDEIEAAARAVGSERTVEAMAAVEQQALDVCGTPLSR